jgi:hypothetical protein
MNKRGRKKAKIESLEEARKYFNSTYGHLISYDELCKLFKNDCITFAYIGKEILHVTRERVRVIYDRYFKAHLPLRKTGHVRKTVCIRKFRASERNTLKQIKDLSPAGIGADLAQKRTLPVERVITSESAKSVSAFLLRVNRQVCTVRICQANSKRWTFNLKQKVTSPYFGICIVMNQGEVVNTYIVPSKKFSRSKVIYIRNQAHESNHTTRNSKYNWAPYLEAWHLLEK